MGKKTKANTMFNNHLKQRFECCRQPNKETFPSPSRDCLECDRDLVEKALCRIPLVLLLDTTIQRLAFSMPPRKGRPTDHPAPSWHPMRGKFYEPIVIDLNIPDYFDKNRSPDSLSSTFLGGFLFNFFSIQRHQRGFSV